MHKVPVNASVFNLQFPVFNAQGSRAIIVVVQVGAVKIYGAALQALRKKETQDEMKLSLPPKLVEKLVSVSVYFFFVKFSFPVTHLIP